MCTENHLMLSILYPDQNLHFLTSSDSLIIESERSKTRFWQVIVHFCVAYCANFLNIVQQNGVTWKDMIDISNFRVWNPMTGTCLNLTFSKKFWLTAAAVFLKVSITSLVLVSNVFWGPRFPLMSQVVSRSSVSLVYYILVPIIFTFSGFGLSFPGRSKAY